MKHPWSRAIAARKKVKATLAQIRQRELSWVLFIVEGLVANLIKARMDNFVTITDKDDDILREAVDNLDKTSRKLRKALGQIPKE